MNSLGQDLKYAFRTLRKSPGFAAAAIVTLALGVGGASTIFAGVDAFFLRALALPDAGRIVDLWAANRAAGFDHANVSYRDFEDWRREARSLAGLAALYDASPTLTGRGEPDTIPGVRVTGDYFSILGLPARLGRVLTPADARPDAPRAAVLSDGAWRRRFGADPRILGARLVLDGQPTTVVGVVAPRAASPGDEWIEVWTALAPDLGAPERGERSYRVVGRLRSGVSLTQARAELHEISQRLAAAYPSSNSGFEVNVLPLEQDLFGKDFRLRLLTLLGAVGLVLVIGCANIAQLLLSRASLREREIAVRTALGASRTRLVRQLLTEDLLLAVLGGGAGLLLAVWGVDAFVRLLPEGTARAPEVHLDLRVFAFGLALSIATAAAFGLLPALYASRSEFGEALSASRGSIGGRHRRLQAVLVTSEVALAIVLLSGAGLLAKSLSHLRSVDPGFRPRHVLTMQVDLPERDYSDGAKILAFFEPLLARVETLPGVRAAGTINTIPLGGSNSWGLITIEERPEPAGKEPRAGWLTASPDYFRALGIPLVEGRSLRATDSASSPLVAVINQEMARHFWPGKSAIGKRFKRGGLDSKRPWVEVVGVVRNARHRGLAVDFRPEFFFPLAQSPERSLVLAVSSESDPAGLAAAIRREVRSLNPGLAVSRVRTLEQLVAQDTAPASLLTRLIAAFAAAAAALATMGLYAVVSLAVGQSTREIGIRMALGAQRRDILSLVLARWMRLALVGMACGLAATLAFGRVMSSLLYTVRPTDAAVLSGITALLAAVALMASYVPAHRATRVDPSTALRAE